MDFFRNLFGKKETGKAAPAGENVVTAPLSEVQLQTIKAMAFNRHEPPQLLVASGQSVGRQRELNEDSLFSLTTTVAGNNSNPPFGLFIIADGMGGHQYGEVASNVAIRTISGYVMKKFHNTLFNLPTLPLDESLQEIAQAAVMEAQRAVLREAPGLVVHPLFRVFAGGSLVFAVCNFGQPGGKLANETNADAGSRGNVLCSWRLHLH